MPRYSLAHLFALITAVALAFAGFWAMNREFDPFDDVKFTPAAWARLEPMERARMSDDLVRNHLLPGGELRIVANSFLKYPPLIEYHLGPCQTLAEGDGFRIYRARRG